MEFFQAIFNILKEIYLTANVDFLHLGFGYMDFLLGASLFILIIKFVLNGFPGLNQGGIMDHGFGLAHQIKISDQKRKEQLIRESQRNKRDYRGSLVVGNYRIMNRNLKGHYAKGLQVSKKDGE